MSRKRKPDWPNWRRLTGELHWFLMLGSIFNFALRKNRVTTVVMRRALLIRKIKEQHELLLNLQDQVDTFMYRSFPSLG